MTPEERAFLRALAEEEGRYGQDRTRAAAKALLGALSVSGEAPPKQWPFPWKSPECCPKCGAVGTRIRHDIRREEFMCPRGCLVGSAPPPEKEPRLCVNMLCDGADCDCPACKPAAAPPKEPPAPSLASEANSPNIGINAPSTETRSVEEILRRVFGALAAEPTPHVRAEMRCDIAEALRLHLGAGVPEGRSEWVLKAEADEKIAALRAERDEHRDRAMHFMEQMKEARAERDEAREALEVTRGAIPTLMNERDEARARIGKALALLDAYQTGSGNIYLNVDAVVAALRGGKVERD